MEEGLEIKIEDISEEPRAKLVRLDGVLDLSTLPLFQKETLNLLEKDLKVIIFELSKLRYLNSSGLATLIRYYIQAREKNIKVCILNPSSFTYEVFESSGVVRIIDICKSLQQALAV